MKTLNCWRRKMDEDWWEDAQQDLDREEEEHGIDCDCAYCEDKKNG